MDTTEITWDDFMKVDIRTGTIIAAEVFSEARKPAYILTVDFGAMGNRKTKQIANFFSECLILGSVDGDVETLITTERKVENGLRIG